MQPIDASLIYHDSPLRLKSFNESISAPVYYTPVFGEKLSEIVKMVDELGASTDMSSIEHFTLQATILFRIICRHWKNLIENHRCFPLKSLKLFGSKRDVDLYAHDLFQYDLSVISGQ